MNNKKQNYMAANSFNSICTPIWNWDTDRERWIAEGFWIQEVLGWTLLPEGPSPVVRTGVKPGGNIFMDERGIIYPSGEQTFRSVEDALRHINDERG